MLCFINAESKSVSQVGRIGGIKRTASLPRSAHMSFSLPRDQIVDRQKAQCQLQSTLTSTRMSNSAIMERSVSKTKPQKPDSLPSSLNKNQSMSMQRLIQRTPSLSRARTPGTPSDDGRWPSCSARSLTNKRGSSVTPDMSSLKMRTASTEFNSSRNYNIYGTMPRRGKQKSEEDLSTPNSSRTSRSTTMTKENNRMTSSFVLSSGTTRKNLISSYGDKMPPPASATVPNSNTPKTHSSRRSLATKTRIYHETSAQTALTSLDIEKAFSDGLRSNRPIEAAEQSNQQTQTDLRDSEMARLKEQIAQLTQREQQLSDALKRETEEKQAVQRELLYNTERVEGMLELARLAGRGDSIGTPTSDDGSQDSLLMLQSQIQQSGSELQERQQEIGQLRKLCHHLQRELKHSLNAQECLLQEKTNLEQESNELQDFLQNEKSAMCEALKEMENEQENYKKQLLNRDEEIKALRDECRHLVRLNEQRRYYIYY